MTIAVLGTGMMGPGLTVGLAPAVLARDVPGLPGNRLQHAVYREAFHIDHRAVAPATVYPAQT